MFLILGVICVLNVQLGPHMSSIYRATHVLNIHTGPHMSSIYRATHVLNIQGHTYPHYTGLHISSIYRATHVLNIQGQTYNQCTATRLLNIQGFFFTVNVSSIYKDSLCHWGVHWLDCSCVDWCMVRQPLIKPLVLHSRISLKYRVNCIFIPVAY